jgi:hypothetical protein
MSAFLCSPQHIAAIVCFGPITDDYGHYSVGPLPEEVAELLARENVKSVDYRYPRDIDEQVNEVFVKECIAAAKILNKKRPNVYTAVQVIKLCNSLDYQSCEHPGWEASNAKETLDAIVAIAIRNLPGYEAAEWSI